MGDFSSLGMNLFMIISIYKDTRGRHARALLFLLLDCGVLEKDCA